VFSVKSSRIAVIDVVTVADWLVVFILSMISVFVDVAGPDSHEDFVV